MTHKLRPAHFAAGAALVALGGVATAALADSWTPPTHLVQERVRLVQDVDPAEAPQTPPQPEAAPEPAQAPKAPIVEEVKVPRFDVRLFEDDDAEARIIAVKSLDGEPIVLREGEGKPVIILSRDRDVADALLLLDAVESADGGHSRIVIDASEGGQGAFHLFAGDENGRVALNLGENAFNFSIDIQESIEDAMEDAAEAQAEAAEDIREALGDARASIDDALAELNEALAELEDDQAEMSRELRFGAEEEMHDAMEELRRAQNELHRAKAKMASDARRAAVRVEREHARAMMEAEKARVMREFHACKKKDECDVHKKVEIRERKVMTHRNEKGGDRVYLRIKGLDAEELAEFIDDLDDVSDATKKKLKQKLGIE